MIKMREGLLKMTNSLNPVLYSGMFNGWTVNEATNCLLWIFLIFSAATYTASKYIDKKFARKEGDYCTLEMCLRLLKIIYCTGWTTIIGLMVYVSLLFK